MHLLQALAQLDPQMLGDQTLVTAWGAAHTLTELSACPLRSLSNDYLSRLPHVDTLRVAAAEDQREAAEVEERFAAALRGRGYTVKPGPRMLQQVSNQVARRTAERLKGMK